MAVRFVLGRAGSGKTYHCLQSIRNELEKDPVFGARLVLLVPEQAALQMERALIEGESIAGSHRAQVLSFNRLAQLAFAERIGTNHRVLTPTSRAMLLRHILLTSSLPLRHFQAVSQFSGFIDEFGQAVSELIVGTVEPKALRLAADETGDEFQRDKLLDVADLYEAYLERLGEDVLDPGQVLEVARAQLEVADWLPGSQIWVEGFASFTQQELKTLLVLAQRASSCEISLMSDASQMIEPRDAPSTASLPNSLFRKPVQTYCSLATAFAKSGISILPPLELPTKDSRTPFMPRFARSPLLATLEQWLARDGRGIGESDSTGAAETSPAPSSELAIYRLPSIALECEWAVYQVKRHVVEHGLRYRDIAIIVRDLESYYDHLRHALLARGVPHFIDQRRSIEQHALTDFLRVTIALAMFDFRLDDVRLLFKTGLLPFEEDNLDRLENYLLAHGLTSFTSWAHDWVHPQSIRFDAADETSDGKEHGADAPPEAVSMLNQMRSAMVSCYGPWMEFASNGREHTGTEWMQALIACCTRVGVAAAVEGWADDANTRGDLEEAAEHRAVLQGCGELFKELSRFLGDAQLSLRQLADVLDAGMESISLGLAPPSVDQLLVGSIERSRHPNIKVALVLGFNDGVFPRHQDEDPLLNDDDRELLVGRGLGVQPSSRERFLEESLLTYIALTRASERTLLSYPQFDQGGRELHASPLVARLTSAFSSIEIQEVDDPHRTREAWNVLSQHDLARRVIVEMRERPSLGEDNSIQRKRWNTLYDVARSHQDENEIWKRMARSLASDDSKLTGQAQLSATTTKALWSGVFHASVSKLETYASCPFKFYADSVLHLEERPAASLSVTDLGQLYHLVLQRVIGRVAHAKRSLHDYDEDKLLSMLASENEIVCRDVSSRIYGADGRRQYVMARMLDELQEVLLFQRELAAMGRMRPMAVELPFGFETTDEAEGPENELTGTGLPALSLQTSRGNRALLRGFIDRVDVEHIDDPAHAPAAVVVDYKRTRNKRLVLSHAWHGLSLQLLAYMLQLREHGSSGDHAQLDPIAGLYVSLLRSRDRVEHPADAIKSTFPPFYRPRGVIRTDRMALLEDPITGAARGYSAYVKNDQTFGKLNQSDVIAKESFDRLLRHTRKLMEQFVDEIFAGNMRVEPYRIGNESPCNWCPMGSICQFESGLTPIRRLQAKTREGVFRSLADTGKDDRD
ncbi:MAG: PD-(D/E)XK nuclease family protein [Phycisphaerae bacterium]